METKLFDELLYLKAASAWLVSEENKDAGVHVREIMNTTIGMNHNVPFYTGIIPRRAL